MGSGRIAEYFSTEAGYCGDGGFRELEDNAVT